MLVVIWKRSREDVEEAGEASTAFGDSGVLGDLWERAAEIEAALNAGGFVWGDSMRIHVLGWAVNSDTGERFRVNIWSWPQVEGAPLVDDVRGLLSQVREMFRSELVRTIPSGVKGSPWQYLVTRVECEFASWRVQQKPEPEPEKSIVKKVWEWLRKTFDGRTVRSSEAAFNRAPEFVKKSGRWYRAYYRRTKKGYSWGYRKSSAQEKRRYDANR